MNKAELRGWLDDTYAFLEESYKRDLARLRWMSGTKVPPGFRDEPMLRRMVRRQTKSLGRGIKRRVAGNLNARGLRQVRDTETLRNRIARFRSGEGGGVLARI